MADFLSHESSEIKPTLAQAEHDWLKNLVGEWTVKSECVMGLDGPCVQSFGKESMQMFGDLWVLGEGEMTADGGETTQTKNGLGFDVSANGYRHFSIVTASSHLWKSVGVLNETGRKMTLDCEGLDKAVDGKTAPCRDVIELVDADHRNLISFAKDESGEWVQFMRSEFTRA